MSKQWKAEFCLKRHKGKYIDDCGVVELTGNNKSPRRIIVACGMSKADAILAAAAPNLVEACKAAANILSGGSSHSQMTELHEEQVFAMLKDAIAKAEGA